MVISSCNTFVSAILNIWWTSNNSIWHNSQPTDRANVNREKTPNWQERTWVENANVSLKKNYTPSYDRSVDFPGGSINKSSNCIVYCWKRLPLKVSNLQKEMLPFHLISFSKAWAGIIWRVDSPAPQLLQHLSFPLLSSWCRKPYELLQLYRLFASSYTVQQKCTKLWYWNM